MDIQEIKKIELTKEETENLIRNGLGISKASEVKFSMKVPEKVKLTITTVTTETEVKPVQTGAVPLGTPKAPAVQVSPGDKVCGNCIYPYPLGEEIFCSMENKTVPLHFTCGAFEPKMQEPTT